MICVYDDTVFNESTLLVLEFKLILHLDLSATFKLVL